jgi:predicted O-methyltransferase YrrM
VSYYFCPEVLAYIRKTLPAGSTILELGSGTGTGWLAEDYKMYSIENKSKYVGRENSTYIYAPLKEYKIPKFPEQTQWYDADILEKEMPKKYDMILVDGPANTGRGGFARFIHLFRDDVPILFDDIRRADEMRMALRVAHKLNRPLTIVTHAKKNERNWFGVCYPDTSNDDFL